MKHSSSWIQAKFIKRYKRFFADIEIDGVTHVAHVPNTGSLKSCSESGSLCWVSKATNPERKLRWTLEAIQTRSGVWVGVNTSWPNLLAKEAFQNKVFKHWQSFDSLRSEVKINSETRLDLALSFNDSPKNHYVEIKNVTLAENEVAQFPDAVTERGQKHLRELIKLMEDGHSAELLFVIQRGDCRRFSPADHIDPTYGQCLRDAHKQGLIITPAVVSLTQDEIFISGETVSVSL